jgi:iron(III) transport system substrate-binding protein
MAWPATRLGAARMSVTGTGRAGLSATLLLAIAAMPAAAAERAWLDPALLAAAKTEGAVTIFSAINEEEELPLLQVFQDATGIKADYVRSADAALMARITIEKRAGKDSWDVLEIQAIEGLPSEWRLPFSPPEAAHLLPGARDPGQRWYGDFLVYHTPAYNTRYVKRSDLPQSYADFAKHPEWAGHVAIDSTDRNWLAGVIGFYGEAQGMAIMRALAATLRPALYKGHLALARAVGSGEYWIALNNYVNLTLSTIGAGDPEDWWILEPVVTTYCGVAVNAKAPHANAAKLLVNYMISAEAQQIRTKAGHIPTRTDVATDPPDMLARFAAKQKAPGALQPEADAKWQKIFNDIFKQ